MNLHLLIISKSAIINVAKIENSSQWKKVDSFNGFNI